MNCPARSCLARPGSPEVISLSPQRFPGTNHDGAMAFVRWLTSPVKGQRLIERFGVEKYGAPMFFPDSREWRAAHEPR